MSPRRAALLLVGAGTLLRLGWADSIGVGNDEAYHYLFTVHRDWSYFDHPPMTALIEQVGLGLAGGAVTPFALRLGFIGLFAGSTLLMARFAGRLYGPTAGVLAAFALNVTAYYGAAASTFALPDGPLLFFWILTLDRLAVALADPDRLRPWVGVGLAWGGALLSKYSAVLLPAGTLLYLLADRDARGVLRRPGPYLAAGVGLLAFAPVIGWNAAHGWASFTFQGARALGGVRFRPVLLAEAIAGQVLYLLPWMWFALVVVLVWRVRRWRRGEANATERWLICQSAPPLVAFLAVACHREVLPHWSLVGFIAAFPLVGADWAAHLAARPKSVQRRLLAAGAAVVVGCGLVAVEARWGLLQRGAERGLGLLPPEYDPTVETYGWDQITAELRRRRLLDRPGTFLFTSKWYHSGQLAFAAHDATPVLCYNPQSHGFAQWSRPGDWVGKDGILVVVNRSSTEPQMFDTWFERIEPLDDFSVVRAGGPVRRVRLYRCVRQLVPFPFDDPSAARGARRAAEAAVRRLSRAKDGHG